MDHNVKPENLKRALAIMTTEPDENDIATGGRNIYVAGQKLNLDDCDDYEVLAVLMANKEFGFAAGKFEMMAAEMRRFQHVWFEAADAMKKEAAA